jgi:hypothetical protein
VVDAVAQDVEVLAQLVDGGDLDGGNHRDAVLGARGDRLADPVDRVVIGQRQQPHARRARRRDDLGGLERPVAAHGVRLQVKARRPVVVDQHRAMMSRSGDRRRAMP